MILAADLGGTTIKLGLVGEGAVRDRLRLPAESSRPMAERLEAVARGWEKMLAKAGGRGNECEGVALALPFLVDADRGRVRGDFGKFPGAPEIDFAAWSEARLGLPVRLENDLRAALLGEWAAGSARGCADVVMLAFGTGIGCAVLAGGRLLRGARNRAGSLVGHSTIAYAGEAGRCGNLGCAEDLASTATLGARARAWPGFGRSRLAKEETIDFQVVFELAERGDACARALRDECLGVWSVVVLNAALAYDPQLVVLGGGVLGSAATVIPAVERHLREHAPAGPVEISVVASKLGDDAALLGGAMLFRDADIAAPS